MDKTLIQLPVIGNPAASQKNFQIPLPRDLRIHKLILEHAYSAGTNTLAAAVSNLTEMRFVVGSRSQRVASGDQWRDHNLLHGTAYDFQGVPNVSAFTAGVQTATGAQFTLDFAERWNTNNVTRDQLAFAPRWAGGAYNFVGLQLDFGAAASPTVALFAEVDDFVPPRPAPFVKWERLSIPTVGKINNYKITAGADRLLSIHLYPDTTATPIPPTRVVLKQGSRVLHEATRFVNFAHNSESGYTPTATGRTAKMHDIIFDDDDNLDSGIWLGDGPDLDLSIESSDTAMSGTVTALIRRFGLPS